jgi:hypothetical protein
MTKRKTSTRARKTQKRVSGQRTDRIAMNGPRPDFAPEMVRRIERLNREQVALKRAIRISREKTLAEYRARFTKLQKGQEGQAKRIFAEGDSWFKYPLGDAVISQLEGLIGTPIANFAWPGAESRQLLGVHEREEIERRLRDGPEKGKKFDILLFSGGGDDIVGDPMVLFLNRYDPKHPQNPILNTDRFNKILDLVMDAYRDLVSLRNQHSSDTLIVGHVYDYAWATGIGACGYGPWLRPSLDYAQVPRGGAQHAVLIEMLQRFEARLTALAAAAGKFIVVPTHGTLTTEPEWANELHPKDPGFHKFALKFRDALQPHL